MGQQASLPQPGAKLQVIGAGVSRTGTAALSHALEILLDGPVYHGGTQSLLGPDRDVKGWMRALRHFPPRTSADRALIDDTITRQLAGFVAATDVPIYHFTADLVRLYPDALVVCTVRDPETWVRSLEGLQSATGMWFLRFALLPLPTLRYLVPFVDLLRQQWESVLGVHKPLTTRAWDDHIAYVKRSVPPERLLFFDVRDGWEPLCKALGRPVPDVPFPRINDGKAMDEFAKKQVARGLVRWACIVGLAAIGYVALIRMGWARWG